MIKALKSYWAFTGKIYRLVVLLLFPLLAVIVPVIVGMIDLGMLSLGIICYYVIFMMAEPLADYWFLGGFYSKNKGALEFLQSSNHFSSMIRDVVVVDLVRRVVLNVFIFLVMVCIGIIDGIEPEGYMLFALFPLLEILLGEVVTLIGRHFDLWNYYYIVVLLCYMAALLFIAYGIISAHAFLHWICLALAILAIVVAVAMVAYTDKKVRDSYYDK